MCVAAVVAVLSLAVAGCEEAGGPRAAGAVPTASGPVRLWPGLTPASSPAWDYEDGASEVVEGVEVPGGDVRKVDPVAVVRAEVARRPEDYTAEGAPYRETARRLDSCGTPGDRDCPVLRAYHRDLTGDGRPELTLGFRLLPGHQTAVRVYTVDRGRLMQVMANDDAVSAVELAGRSVIVHAPSDLADYEYRFQWTWDAGQKAMLLTHDEMLRVGPSRPPSSPRPSASPRTPAPSGSSPAGSR